MVQDCNKELIDTLNVRTFPTFRFYVNGSQVDETRGAVIQEVASKVREGVRRERSRPGAGVKEPFNTWKAVG